MKRLAPAFTRLVLRRPGARLAAAPGAAADEPPHRSPIALALSADGSRLLTANQTSGTVSLVDTRSGRVLDEVATGEKPAGVAIAATAAAGSSRTGMAMIWRSSTSARPARGGRPGRGRSRAAWRRASAATAGRLTSRGREQRGRAGRPRDAAGHRPAGRRPRAARHRADARRRAAARGQRPVAEPVGDRDRGVDRRADAADRGRQPPAGRDRPRRQDRLRGQHAEPRVRHDPQQHRPGLGARPAPDAGAARRLGRVCHALARPAGPGRRRMRTAWRSAPTGAVWRSAAAERTK